MTTAQPDELSAKVGKARQELRRHYRPARIEVTLQFIVAEARAAKNRRAEAAALLELAAVARYQFDPVTAAERAQGALDLYEILDDRPGQAAAHLELAKIDLDMAIDPDTELAAAAAAALDPTGEIEPRALYVRARAALRAGRLAEAERLLKAAVDRIERHPCCAYVHARYLAQLGLVERLRGAEVAELHLLEAMDRARRDGFVRVEASCLLDLGQIALKDKDFDTAERQLTAAAARFADIDDALGQAHALSALGATVRLLGRLEGAIVLLRRALAVYAQRHHPAGGALAHRRLAQCYIDLLELQAAKDRTGADYRRAQAEIDLAIELFDGLDSRDGLAVALATRAKLGYLRRGAVGALNDVMAAVKLLGQVRGQFRPGLERLQFGRLHGWVFGFAMLCAVEAGSVDQALLVAAVVRAETLGGIARQTLRAQPGDLGAQLLELCDQEQGLGLSGSEAVRLPAPPGDLRARRDRLATALDGDLARALTPPLQRPRPRPGQYRLCVQLFDRSHRLQPLEDDTLYVQCEGAAKADKAMAQVELLAGEREAIEALAAGDADHLGDGRRLRWERLGQVIVPVELLALRAALVGRRVAVLEIEPDRNLVRFPFGALLIDGHRLDELTCVLLSPSDLPTCRWLWNGQDSPWSQRQASASRHPSSTRRLLSAGLDPAAPAPSAASDEDSFGAIVAGLGDIGSFTYQELMEMASGEHTFKQIFLGEEKVAANFRMTVERHQQRGLDLLEAVQAAKASHRQRCGRACPPSHVGGFVVAGRLEDTPALRKAS